MFPGDHVKDTKRAADSKASLMPGMPFSFPMYVYPSGRMYVCTHAGEGQRRALGILLHHSPLMDWARGSHCNLELTGPAGLVASLLWKSPALPSVCAGVTGSPPCPSGSGVSAGI